MKKSLLILTLSVLVIFGTCVPLTNVRADGPSTSNSPTVGNSTNNTTQTFTLSNPLSKKFDSIGSLIEGFVEIFSYIVIIIAVLMIIWVGLQYILAQGKPERMKELTAWLGWIIVGVAIVIGARIIVNVVINTLEATGTVNKNVINNSRNAANGQ